MENTILDFTKVYENFTGSGNINGKYWIVGLESGGKLAPNENSNKYVGTINNGNELEIAEYLSTFNDDEIENTGFLSLLNKVLISIREYENCIKDNKYNFSEVGNVFRTNLYPLKQESIEEPIYEIYKKRFNLSDGINKNELYDEQIIKKRALKLKSLLNKNPINRIILLLIPSSNTKFIKDALFLINNIFESEFNPKNFTSFNFPLQKIYYIEYLSSNKDIRVIHYPQRFSLTQSDINVVGKRLNIL